jgi:hypothetical protein
LHAVKDFCEAADDAGDMVSTQPGAILLLSFAEAHLELANRLRPMGFAVQEAEGLEEAVRAVRQADPPIGAVLLPWPTDVAEPLQTLHLLREVSPARALRFVLLGKPHPSERSRLRAAVPGLVLAEPFTETELRFVLNYVLYSASQGESRRAARVPTRMLARVRVATGEKDVLVYSLSEDGAFLETPRPSQPGSSIELELPLPSRSLQMHAEVLAANVPGSSYRRHVPKGMGIRFTGLTPEAREHLENYIDTRARLFQI